MASPPTGMLRSFQFLRTFAGWSALTLFPLTPAMMLTVHVIGQADTTWKRAKKIEPDRLVDMGQIAKVGQIRHCMVTFDLDGKLKREMKIEVPFHVYQIAPFRNGMFVVAGADKSKKKSIVALVSQDGEFLRTIEAQGDLSAERFEKTASKSDHRPQISSFDMALNASTMVADGDRVLLLRTEQADAPVIAIPPSGESKAITIKASEGHAVFSITPSESGWMVQFVRDLGGGAVEMKLCVVDRHTGVTHRCYKPEANVGLGFACHDSDHFTFLKRDPDTDNTILLTETPE